MATNPITYYLPRYFTEYIPSGISKFISTLSLSKFVSSFVIDIPSYSLFTFVAKFSTLDTTYFPVFSFFV